MNIINKIFKKKTEESRVRLTSLEVEEQIKKGWWDLYVSNLPKPKIIDTKVNKEIPEEFKEGVPRGFSIEVEKETWTTYFNNDDVPNFRTKQECKDFARSVGGHHETSHYTICPGSKRMNVKLVDSALKGFSSETRKAEQRAAQMAHLVTNIFGDWVIDYQLGVAKYGREDFSDLTRWRMKSTIDSVVKETKDLSPLWKILVRTYEKLFDDNFGLQGHIPIDGLEERLSNECFKIMGNDFSDSATWPDKSRAIASVLENILNQSEDKNERESSSGEDKGNSYGVPKDVQKQMGPSANKNPYNKFKRSERESSSGKDKENSEKEGRPIDQEILEEIYQLNKNNPSQFAGTLAAFEPELVDRATKLMYRMRAKEYLIKVLEEKSSGTYGTPAGYNGWDIGNPLMGRGGLEIIPSIMSHGKILPGINTTRKKYETSTLPGQLKQIKDLVFYIDSSGSMDWNPEQNNEELRGSFDKAIVAAEATALYVLERGGKVAIVNFSGDKQYKYQKFTRNLDEFEDALILHYNGGTTFPISIANAIVEENASNGIVSCYISDFEIYNSDQTQEFIKKTTHINNPSYLFDIGGRENFANSLKGNSHVKGIPIKNLNDLKGVILGEVKRNW